MLGILTIIAHCLGFVAKNALTFAKWVVAQGRLLWGQAWVLFNWWLKYSQHSIVLRVAAWAAWTVAIEAAFAVLSRITIEPLASGFLRTVLPADNAVLYLVWDAGLNFRIGVRCLVAYLGMYLTLQAAVRSAQRTQRLVNQRWVDPRVFSR